VGASSYWRWVHVGRHVVDLSWQSHLHRQTILKRHSGSFAIMAPCLIMRVIAACAVSKKSRWRRFPSLLQCADTDVCREYSAKTILTAKVETVGLLHCNFFLGLQQGAYAHAHCSIVTVRFKRRKFLVLQNEACWASSGLLQCTACLSR